ncbi:AaceriAFR327Cp [[Ashbya] aceris (nom. inval.)]|nr:AaceriAFR327Cp [[Ashbya] aceris (nom. inval.)]
MAEEVALSLEETNEIRRKLGLPLIPVNSAKTEPRPAEHRQKEIDTEGIALPKKDTPSSIADRNKNTENTAATAASDDTDQFIDRRVLQLQKRISKRRTKPLLNLEADDEDDWLESIGTRERPRNAGVRPIYDDDGQEQPQEFRVSHTSSVLSPGKDIVLTLKETSVLDDDEEIVLENAAIKHDEEVKMNMELRQLNKERKFNKSALNDPSKTAKYTEDGSQDSFVHGSFKISADSAVLDDDRGTSDKVESLNGKRKLDPLPEDGVTEAPGDYEPIKIKKRKKPQKLSTVRKKDRSLAPVKVQLVDEDELIENEDEHFYSNLNISKVTKDRAIEKIVEDACEERAERKQRARNVDSLRNGVVIDETDLFLDSLKDDILEGESFSSTTDKPTLEAQKMDSSSAKSVPVTTVPVSTGSDNPTPDFYTGLGSTLQYLKDKKMFSDASTPKTSVDQKRLELLQIQQQIAAREVGERIDSQFVGATSLSKEDQERLDKYKEEEIMRAAAPFQRERVAGYNPNVTLTYKDNSGRPLNAKEAFKKISQAWNGARASRKLANQRRRDQKPRD